MAFHLLAEPIRRYVRDQRWEELRPIQAAAIQHILADDDNYILASRTASGNWPGNAFAAAPSTGE